MSGNLNTELLPVIEHLEKLTNCLEGITKVLRDIAARPWPDIPDGEGVAGEASAGIMGPAGSLCVCGHLERVHQPRIRGMASCRMCRCSHFSVTNTDPGE